MANTTKDNLRVSNKRINSNRSGLSGPIDLNYLYKCYFMELHSMGYSYNYLSELIGLHRTMLNLLVRNKFDRPLRFDYVVKAGILTGHHFNITNYIHLLPNKEYLITEAYNIPQKQVS